ncbi:DUF1330 domain-containing protein [Thermoproteota archaeon]
MKGYVVTNFTVNNPDTFKKYLSLVGETVDKYKGKFLVRGPIENVLEGTPFKFLAIVEFNSVKEAETWFYSQEYKDIIEMRLESSEGWFIITQEFSPPK